MKNKAQIIYNIITTISRKSTAISMWSRKRTWKAPLQLKWARRLLRLSFPVTSSLARKSSPPSGSFPSKPNKNLSVTLYKIRSPTLMVQNSFQKKNKKSSSVKTQSPLLWLTLLPFFSQASQHPKHISLSALLKSTSLLSLAQPPLSHTLLITEKCCPLWRFLQVSLLD